MYVYKVGKLYVREVRIRIGKVYPQTVHMYVCTYAREL